MSKKTILALAEKYLTSSVTAAQHIIPEFLEVNTRADIMQVMGLNHCTGVGETVAEMNRDLENDNDKEPQRNIKTWHSKTYKKQIPGCKKKYSYDCIDLVVIPESWLNDDIPGYQIVRKDRGSHMVVVY